MPTSSSSSVIVPLSCSDHSSSSLLKTKSTSNVNSNNKKNSTSKQRQGQRPRRLGAGFLRTISIGAVLASLVSWEVFNGVNMTSFKSEIGMIEESLLLLNMSIASISESLSFLQQPIVDVIAATSPLTIKPQSQQPQPQGGATEDYRLKRSPKIIIDLLCSECRTSMASVRGGTMACGNMIQNQIQKIINKNHNSNNNNNNNQSSSESEEALLLRLAVSRVLEIAPVECARCRFDACKNTTLSSEREYWRPDDAAPRVVLAKTLQLSTIPWKHRVPPFLLSNLTLLFSNKSNVYPARTYYFEYNPSIIQIPKSQIPTSVLTTTQQEQQEEEVDQEVKYLASFRVTNTQQCVSGQDELDMIGGQWPRPPSQDYLGLALLRSDLSVIANVVLNNRKVPSLSSMEDYRLFVLHDQIYVASWHEIVPLWLVPPKPASFDQNTIQVVPNLFPSNFTVMARSFSSCPNVRLGSKNINYFWDHDRNETIVEDEPMGRKMTIDLTKKCRINASRPNKNLLNTDANKPFRSFGSVDELHFAKHGVFRNVLTGERGSACCVRITDPRSSSSSNVNDTNHDANNGGPIQPKFLWLGISHSKFKFRSKEARHNLPGNVSANHFFSSFYAFDAQEPFTVQAISGRFCLGFPTLNETTTTTTMTGASASDKDKNPYGRQNANALRLGADYFDCPAIHFVSGMVEKADDPSRIVIAYGVNDCAPRFVEVEKKEIQQMLSSKMQS